MPTSMSRMVHEHPVADMSSCVYRITFTSSRSSSSSMGCGHTPLQRRRRRRNSTSNRMGYYSRSGIHLSSAYSSAAIMGTSNNAGRPSLPPSLLSPLQPPPSGGQEEQQALTPPLDQPSMALIIPVVNKFHRNTSFTASFTTMYEDTTLSGVAIHEERLQRHALIQKDRLQRRRKEYLRLHGMLIRYQDRVHYLRLRIREDQQRRIDSFLGVVRRMQAIFRRKQLLKVRQAEERRRVHAAALALQRWIRGLLAIGAAKRELARRRDAAQRRAAAAVVTQFMYDSHLILQAKRRRKELKEKKRQRQLVFMKQRQMQGTRELVARREVALFCQKHYRGWRDRHRVYEMRMWQMNQRNSADEGEPASYTPMPRRKAVRRQALVNLLHQKPFRY